MNTISDRLAVHLGCGAKYVPGFLHVDILPLPNVDVVCDVANLEFLNENSVDLLYASHVLEHFGRHQYFAVLSEWYRVLKIGGILRLAVPDFRACAEQYLKSGSIDGPLSILGLVCGGQ